MSSLYDTYATQTRSTDLDHRADIRRVARHLRRHLLPVLPSGIDLGKSRIFEFGAGWGRNLLALAELGACDLRGIDISAEQVAIGHRLGLDRLELVPPGAAPPSSVDEARFDIVLAIDVLEHLDLDALHAFSGLVRRTLVPGGLLIVQVPNALAPFNPVPAGDLTHLRGFTPGSLRQFLTLAGTDALHLSGIPFPGEGPGHALRSALARALVQPAAALISLLLYGRSADPVRIEPNLLCIGRARGSPAP
jgi:SAM-dependent methyltransferase